MSTRPTCLFILVAQLAVSPLAFAECDAQTRYQLSQRFPPWQVQQMCAPPQQYQYSVPQSQQVPYSNMCVTPYGSCAIYGAGPVGYACWCPSPYGPINGAIR